MTPLSPSTELDAVNTMLSVIGEAPVNTLDVSGNAYIESAQGILREVSRDVQVKGWHFNTERDYTLSRDGNSKIPLPTNALQVSTSDEHYNIDVAVRGGFLYDKKNHTLLWPDYPSLKCRIVFFLDFEELPQSARSYITIVASRTFQERTLGSDALHKFTQDDETRAMAQMTREELRAAKRNMLIGSMSVNRILRKRPF